MIMFACSYGAAFGAIQMMPQIAPGLKKDVTEYSEKIAKGQERQNERRVARGEEARPVAKGKQLEKLAEQKLASDYTKVQEIGGLVGRFLLAALAVVIVSRRGLLRIFQVPGLIVMPLFFWYFLQIENTKYFDIPLDFLGVGSLPVTNVSLGMMLAGLFTVAQFSFWGNYLPRVYPVHLRGTGESFAANIGGRLIGTSFAFGDEPTSQLQSLHAWGVARPPGSPRPPPSSPCWSTSSGRSPASSCPSRRASWTDHAHRLHHRRGCGHVSAGRACATTRSWPPSPRRATRRCSCRRTPPSEPTRRTSARSGSSSAASTSTSSRSSPSSATRRGSSTAS